MLLIATSFCPPNSKPPYRDETLRTGVPTVFPDRAAPTVLEGFIDLVRRVSRRGRSEPERVGAFDAARSRC